MSKLFSINNLPIIINFNRIIIQMWELIQWVKIPKDNLA